MANSEDQNLPGDPAITAPRSVVPPAQPWAAFATGPATDPWASTPATPLDAAAPVPAVGPAPWWRRRASVVPAVGALLAAVLAITGGVLLWRDGGSPAVAATAAPGQQQPDGPDGFQQQQQGGSSGQQFPGGQQVPGGSDDGGTGRRGFGGTSAMGTLGTVTAVDGSTLTISTRDGTAVQVSVDADTTVTSPDGSADAVSDLASGDTILVAGSTGSDGRLVASRIVVLPGGGFSRFGGPQDGTGVAPQEGIPDPNSESRSDSRSSGREV